jgi:hypothetical protein
MEGNYTTMNCMLRLLNHISNKTENISHYRQIYLDLFSEWAETGSHEQTLTAPSTLLHPLCSMDKRTFGEQSISNN